MRKKIIILFIVSFFNNLNGQENIVSSKENFNEALSYLNLFLNDKNWAKEDSGSFTYNNYAKSLSFKSKTEIQDSKNTIIEIEYILNLKNVIAVKEIMYKTNSNNIIFFDIKLKDEIFYTKYTKQYNDIIPNYKKENVSTVSIQFSKKMTSDDLDNMRRAIREIFTNVPVETKIL